MDLQERRQLDLAERMTKVRARARPWRSILALIFAIAAAVAAQFWGIGSVTPPHRNEPVPAYQAMSTPGYPVQKLIWIIGLAVFVVLGLVAAVGLAGRARSALQPLIGEAHAGVVRYVLVLVEVFVIATIALAIIGVSPDRLVLGGAVTGVLIGIAAQQSLANLFAGLVLLFAHPFRVGDHVRFRAGALSGEIDGVVTDLSLTYVRLETNEGRMLLPNAQALSAAVLLIPEPYAASSDAVAEPPAGDTSEAAS